MQLDVPLMFKAAERQGWEVLGRAAHNPDWLSAHAPAAVVAKAVNGSHQRCARLDLPAAAALKLRLRLLQRRMRMLRRGLYAPRRHCGRRLGGIRQHH